MEVDGAGPGSAAAGCYNYVVTAHKATAVTHAAVASFTGPNDLNLITACCTRLEIRTLGAQGLTAVLDVPIYGTISALQTFRPRDATTDLLFILTEQYKFCVLQYDAAKGQLVTRSNGDVADRIGRPADNGQLGCVDPLCRLIGLHLYDGMLKVIPMDERSGLLSEAFNLRLEEVCVLDMAWLYPQTAAQQQGGGGAGPSGSGGSGGGPVGRPLLCVLHQDPKHARHVKTYELQLGAKELVDGPWQQQHVDSGAAHLIPVPSPLGGVVVVGENVVTYLGGPGGQAPVSAPLRQTIITAWCPVDPDGSRFLLGDHRGQLQLLVLAHDGGGRVSGLRVEPLGAITSPSCLAYLDSGLTFVGSRTGDSQLIRISESPVNQPSAMEDDEEGAAAGGGGGPSTSTAAPAGPVSEQQPLSYIEVVDSYPSMAPVVDFVVMDLERQGQGQLVTCSGVDGDGSLRVIRNGIGINRQATVELPGIKGVWSLRLHYGDETDTYLLLTFVGETRVLALNAEEELDEAELPGFDSGSQTLWCGNMASDHLVQVTSSGVRLVDSTSLQLVSEWRPAPGFSINVAAGSPTQVVVATGGGHLVYLEVVRRPPESGGAVEVVEISNVVLDSEVACVDVSPLLLLPSAQDSGPDASSERSSLVAVGRWDQTLQLLSAPSLEPLSTTPLGGEVIPRSVLCTALEGVPYCMVGLGDGALHTWRLDPATGSLSDRKRVVLGTKPITLRTFRTAAAASSSSSAAGATDVAAAAASGGGGGRGGPGGLCVFAASDRPTVVYSSNRKLLYSNLNENDVTYLASFHSAPFPHSLAVASEGALTIGTADDLQKLHVRTVPLGEQPRRIAHHEGARLLGVLTHRREYDGEERCHFRLLDDVTFDVIASYDLAPNEVPCSLAAWGGPQQQLGGAGGGNGAAGGAAAGGPGAAGGAANGGAGGGGANGGGASGGAGGTGAAGESSAPWFLVGTAFVLPDEPEPTRGRILVLEHVPGGGPGGQGKVRVVAEREVRGAVYGLTPFMGDKVLAAVNSKITVYRWVVRDGSGAAAAAAGTTSSAATPAAAAAAAAASGGGGAAAAGGGGGGGGGGNGGGGAPLGGGAPELVSECSYAGQVLALYLATRGNLVVVGDLMRSVSLVSYNSEQGVLEHRAADYNTGWTTAVEALDDDMYIAADNHCNVYVVQRNADSATDEERAKLQVVGEFHTGSFINRFRSGSLVMRLPDSEFADLPPPLLFAGTDGRLGVIARLPGPVYDMLSKLQSALRQVVRGVGGLSHEAFRAFTNDRRTAEAPRGFVDGDLIETFLDLAQEDASRVAALMGPDTSVEDLTRRVEELARALH